MARPAVAPYQEEKGRARLPGPPRRKTLPHEVPSWVEDGAIYFITVCCLARGRNQLCACGTARQIFEAVEFRQAAGDWFCRLCVLMPDHLHMLVSFPRDRRMRKVVSLWKQRVARSCGIRWQRDFFDHRLRADESYREKASYIRMNPCRKMLATRPEDWPYVWEPDQHAPFAGIRSAPSSCDETDRAGTARPAVAPCQEETGRAGQPAPPGRAGTARPAVAPYQEEKGRAGQPAPPGRTGTARPAVAPYRDGIGGADA